jgi:hypothetical protein
MEKTVMVHRYFAIQFHPPCFSIDHSGRCTFLFYLHVVDLIPALPIVKTFFFFLSFPFFVRREACKTDPLGDVPGVYSGFL